MEIKFPSMKLETWVLDNRQNCIIDKNEICISPIETQIAFKLFLGSEKDLEDAKHIYGIFKSSLDNNLLESLLNELKHKENFRRYLT